MKINLNVWHQTRRLVKHTRIYCQRSAEKSSTLRFRKFLLNMFLPSIKLQNFRRWFIVGKFIIAWWKIYLFACVCNFEEFYLNLFLSPSPPSSHADWLNLASKVLCFGRFMPAPSIRVYRSREFEPGVSEKNITTGDFVKLLLPPRASLNV